MTSAAVLGSLAPSSMWPFAAGAVHFRRSNTSLARVHELGSRPPGAALRGAHHSSTPSTRSTLLVSGHPIGSNERA